MKPYKKRMILMSLLLVLVFGAVFARLYYMIVDKGETYQSRAENKSTKTITVFGKRGTIYDTNMVPLAYDETSYNVTFYRDPTKSTEADRAAYTKVLIDVISLIESNGKTTVNDFWLKKDEDGVYRFDTGSTSAAVESTREKQWRTNFYLTGIAEKDLWTNLCTKYCIPADLDEEMAVKVLALWQESRMNAFNSTPVTIAYNVGFETVSEIESKSMDLDGVDITESSTRVYPQGTTACHTVGYISKISATQLETYQNQGYPNDAFIGAAGIEYSLEDQLTPYIAYRQGSRVVEINTRGKVVRELNYVAPTNGNSVVLTVDIDLQNVMSKALINNIDTIHGLQTTTIAREYWQDNNKDVLKQYADNDTEIQLAQSGAIVAMDPYSGRLLGMVSYPQYDLSMFNGGNVNMEMWNALLDNSNPLLNRAIATKDTPGSIFKLCTSLAGLSEGVITANTVINDEGGFYITNPENPAKCWVRESERYKHQQNQTIVDAIKHSCNYFFYTVSYKLGVTKLYDWAAALGLTSKTNIELPGEATSFVGNQEMLYDPTRSVNDQYTSKPLYADRTIRAKLAEIATARNTEFTDEQIDDAVNKLLSISVSYEQKADWPAPIREVLVYDLGIPANYVTSHYLVNTFYTYLQDLFWTPNETIMDGIGQSITQLTPITVARYVSAIVNGGTVYDAQVVDKVIAADGTVVLDKEPVIANQINTDPTYFDLIREGMKDVASAEDGGTAGKYFQESKYYGQIAAKTGTSQRTELDVENNAWIVCYAPISDPKIVVVVYIQNGYQGAYAAQAAIDTIEYYLDSLGYSESTQIGTEYTIAD